MSKKIKYLLGFLVIIAAVSYLATTTLRSSLQYYVTVSELYSSEKDYSNKVLKVGGIAQNIQRDENEAMSFEFDVIQGGKTLHTSYRGMTPDTFKNGAEVVVTGTLAGDGSFEATEILAKCASKYEAQVQ